MKVYIEKKNMHEYAHTHINKTRDYFSLVFIYDVGQPKATAHTPLDEHSSTAT